MNNKHILNQEDVKKLVRSLIPAVSKVSDNMLSTETFKIYGVPRGGHMVAHYLTTMLHSTEITFDAAEAHVIVDDIIDSGVTRDKYKTEFPSTPFFALVDKTQGEEDKAWYVFPWEKETEADGPRDAVVRLLEFIGEDPNREGLQETPERVLKAWKQMTVGYGQDPAELLKVFEDGAEGDGEMITVKNIPVYTNCEHHMITVFGVATVSYIAKGKIVGLSKINRLVDMFARRLQVQERLTTDIANALADNLSEDVAVHIEARHMCMEARGICQQGHSTVTSALRGRFKEQPETRAEFYSICKK